jgi:predicted DNA-binding protein (MmcQ/YjbR family)
MPRPSAKASVPSPGKRTAALKAKLDDFPAASASTMAASRGTAPLVLIYKVMGKTFAILSVRADEFVLLKADPATVLLLRDRYAGIGHRSHLDPRHWIAVALDSDVPAKDVAKLAKQSYDLVCAGLTKRQQAELAAMTKR